jgi:O-acetyl-ADP-ribose deacetylase (regulator of RNase III)
VLVASANPFLNLSGGVGGELLERCGPELQEELRRYLAVNKLASVAPGAVVCASARELPFKHILHVVAIDAFYDTSVELVRHALTTCFDKAVELGALTIALPALATGYGRLPMADFAAALRDIVGSRPDSGLLVTLVLHTIDDREAVEPILSCCKKRI